VWAHGNGRPGRHTRAPLQAYAPGWVAGRRVLHQVQYSTVLLYYVCTVRARLQQRTLRQCTDFPLSTGRVFTIPMSMFARLPQPQHSINFWMVSLPAWFLTEHVRSLAYGLRSATFRSIEDRKTWMMILQEHRCCISVTWIMDGTLDGMETVSGSPIQLGSVSCVYFTRHHLLGIQMGNDSRRDLSRCRCMTVLLHFSAEAWKLYTAIHDGICMVHDQH
jgi:hypothetical protein